MLETSSDSQSEYDNAQSVAASQRGKAKDGTAKCHEGNWIHVRYEYTEGDPVTDAVFVVQKPNEGKPGGEVIAEGVVTIGPQAEYEFVHVDLGDYSGPVEVFFFDDPTEPVPYEENPPVQNEQGFLARCADGVIGGVKWVGQVGMGDFNENMSTGQIITNAVVTAVPVVDQVADARDLIANGKALIWDKRYNELGVWVGVFACLIGLFPSLGSLAKGVIKLVWKNAGEIGGLLIYINKALHKTGKKVNGYRFLKKLADELPGKVAFVSKKFDEFLNYCVSKASALGMVDTLATIERVRGMARQKFNEVAIEISTRISKGLAKYATKAWRVMPTQRINMRRAISATKHLGPYPNWLSSMARKIDIKNLEVGSRPITAADRARFLRLSAQAETWADDLLAQTNLPNIIKSMSRDDLIRKMKTFGSKPTLKTFRDGETMDVYRVISDEGQIKGGFWSRSMPPDTEEAWRARDAVMNEWNHGGAFVRSSIPPPEAVLIGEIGPQDLGTARIAPKPGHMLEGGGEQVWIPDHDRGPHSRVDGYYHTNWHAREQATRAIVSAGDPNECDK